MAPNFLKKRSPASRENAHRSGKPEPRREAGVLLLYHVLANGENNLELMRGSSSQGIRM